MRSMPIFRKKQHFLKKNINESNKYHEKLKKFAEPDKIFECF